MWTLILHLPNCQRKEIQAFRIRSHAEQYQQQFDRITGCRFKTEVIWDDPDVDLTVENDLNLDVTKPCLDASGDLGQTSLDWTQSLHL